MSCYLLSHHGWSVVGKVWNPRWSGSPALAFQSYLPLGYTDEGTEGLSDLPITRPDLTHLQGVLPSMWPRFPLSDTHWAPAVSQALRWVLRQLQNKAGNGSSPQSSVLSLLLTRRGSREGAAFSQPQKHPRRRKS